jgi:DNA polymerase-3 subunit gamma/tau
MKFEEVIGQEHITQILKNALQNNRIAHAYIFAGPRGVGKTSTARLLAKAVNCENQPAINPCNTCPTCKSITSGQNLDVIEIDGASNRGIDEIRNLRENIKFSPASARFKIYIIDEVHMLTKEAFNALLKTLEEPPAHAIFMFATTEIHKVPLTILSRCQRFDFKRISTTRIQELLKMIAESEKIKVEDDALFLIARKADGSMRDAESILDQMISFNIENLTVDHIRQSLGLIDQEVYFEFTDLLLEKDSARILQYSKKIFASGHDLIDFAHGLQEHFRNLLLALALKETKQLEVADHLKDRYHTSSQAFNDKDLIHYLHILGEAEQSLKYSFFPELTLEMLLLKLANKPSHVQIEDILAYINKLKGTPSTGQGSGNPSSSARPPLDKSSRPKTNIVQSDQQPAEPSGPSKNSSQTLIENEVETLKNTLMNYKNMGNATDNDAQSSTADLQLDMESFQKLWPDFIQKVKSTKVALASFLEDGLPYAVDKNLLTIAYDQSNAFAREHVEKNNKLIETIFEKDFNLPVRINFTSVNFKTLGIEQKPRTDDEIMEDLKKKEPILNDIIERFGLVKVLNRDVE